MLRLCTPLIAILVAGCVAPGAPADEIDQSASPSPVPQEDRAPEPSPSAEARSNGTGALAVEEFDGSFLALPTWDEACPSDALGVSHDFAIPAGATYARLELVVDSEAYQAYARLTVDGRVVAEGDESGVLVIDLDPSAIAGGSWIEALVWFCEGVTLIDHGYVGAASFFDRPPPDDYAVIEGP